MRTCTIVQATLQLIIAMSVFATLGLDGILIRDLHRLERQMQYLIKQQQQQQPELQGRFYHTPEPPQHEPRRHRRHPVEKANTIHPETIDLNPTWVQSQTFNGSLLSDTVPMLLVPDFAALLLISYWICDASSGRRRYARTRASRRICPMFREARGDLNETRDNPSGPPSQQQRPWWRSCCGRWKEIRQDNNGDHTSSTPIPLQSSRQPQQPIAPSTRSERRLPTGVRSSFLIRDNVYHTICRVLASIFLVALTIYKPVVYMVQLQDKLYHDQITKDCSSGASFGGGGNNMTALGVTDFCSLFRSRLLLTFVWAFLVLAELVVAYATGELCAGEEETDLLSIGSNDDAGDEEEGAFEEHR